MQSAVKMIIGGNGTFLTTDYTDCTDEGFGVGMEGQGIGTYQSFISSYPNYPCNPRLTNLVENMKGLTTDCTDDGFGVGMESRRIQTY